MLQNILVFVIITCVVLIVLKAVLLKASPKNKDIGNFNLFLLIALFATGCTKATLTPQPAFAKPAPQQAKLPYLPLVQLCAEAKDQTKVAVCGQFDPGALTDSGTDKKGVFYKLRPGHMYKLAQAPTPTPAPEVKK